LEICSANNLFGEQADSENTSISVTNEQNFSFYFSRPRKYWLWQLFV